MNYLKPLAFTALAFNSSHSAAHDINFYDYSIGVSYQALSINDINQGTELDLQVDNLAHALGVYYKGEPKPYIQFAIGLEYVYIQDDNPFEEEITNSITGKTFSRESDVTGTGMFGEIGLISQGHFVENLTIGFLGGYRYNDISRSIIRCSNCEEQALDSFKSSPYLKPFIEYQFTSRIHAQLSYSHFTEDEGFENAISLQVSFVSF